MANIFGSRYTSPSGAGAVWEATADLAQTAFDVGLGIMEQVDSAEAQSQTRSAEVGLLKRYDDYLAWTDENGHNPDAWLPELDTRTKQWKTELMAGVTQRRAQRTVSANIDETLARWRTAVREKQYIRKARNIGIDAEIDVKNLTATPNRILDDGDVTERTKALRLRVAQMWEGKYFKTEKERDDYLLTNLKQIVKHYALQQADAPEDFESLNRIFKETGWMGKDGFDADDITDLKKRFQDNQNIAEGEKNDRARVYDKETRQKILAGPAGGADLPALRDEVLKHPDLDGPGINTLINLIDARIDGVGKKYTNEQKLAAYAEIVEEDDPGKKLQLLFKYAGAFTPEKAQSLYDSIATPTAKDFEDSDAAKDLKGLVDSLGISEPQKFILTSKGYGLLREAIESAEAAKESLDLTKKKMMVVEIYNMLEKETQLGTLPKGQIPSEAILTPTQRAESLGRELDKAVAENRAYRRQAEAAKRVEIIQPKTQAEFDALPKGTRYRRLDGTIWIKR